MKSIRFPDIFNSASTNVVKDLDATKQNLVLLLYSSKGELIGDPWFGPNFKRMLYEQNSYILKNSFKDELCAQIGMLMPQMKVNRSNIKVSQKNGRLTCYFEATNQIDFTTDTYSLVLYDENGTL